MSRSHALLALVLAGGIVLAVRSWSKAPRNLSKQPPDLRGTSTLAGNDGFIQTRDSSDSDNDHFAGTQTLETDSIQTAGSAPGVASRPESGPAEFVDNEYGYAFQFPPTWKFQKLPVAGEQGPLRLVLKGGDAIFSVYLVALPLKKSLTREQVDKNPQKDKVIQGMIDLTIEEIYKRTSKEVGASSIVVLEQRPLESQVSIAFYINTVLTMPKHIVMGMLGHHAIPYGKNYGVAFVMMIPITKEVRDNAREITEVFNSFHLIGEKPLDSK